MNVQPWQFEWGTAANLRSRGPSGEWFLSMGYIDGVNDQG
jgi:hypothetical protein